MFGLICPDWVFVAHPMPQMGGWAIARTPSHGIKMAGLTAYVPAGQSPQSSSDDVCSEPWNSIPGLARRSVDRPKPFTRLPHGPHRFVGCVALSNSPMGWTMVDTPNPGIEMAGLKTHVPAGRCPQPSSEGFCNEPWNSILGRSGRSPGNPHQFMRSHGDQS